MCCGESDPSDWSFYNAPNGKGLKTRVDISHCGFSSTPFLMTSTACKDTSCEFTTGAAAFNDLSRTGFQSYVSLRLSNIWSP